MGCIQNFESLSLPMGGGHYEFFRSHFVLMSCCSLSLYCQGNEAVDFDPALPLGCVVDSHNGAQVNPHLCLVEPEELFWSAATEALEWTKTKPGRPGKGV